MKTILWIHGFPLSPDVFEKQLAIENALHLMPSLPGFGDSAPPDGPMSIDDYAARMLSELDRKGIDKAVFAGLSMGGYICFAALRLAPERVERLILIDTRETADDDQGRQNRHATIEKVRAGGTAPVVEAMLPKMLTRGAPEEMRERVRSIMASASPAGTIAALEAMALRPDASPQLASIRVPVLIVVGEEDTITPPADAGRMAAAIPGARLERIPSAAHLSNYEQPQRFNAAVREFLR